MDRREYTISIMPGLLSVMLTCIITSLAYILCFYELPVNSKEALLLILGVLVGEWKNAMGYWWQSTRSSEEKSKMLANSMPIQREP
jgi:hypothetical protein